MNKASVDIHACALRLLTRRNHSKMELATKLAQRNYAPDAIAAECARLEQLGLLNESEFCCMYVQSRAERGFGPARIMAELHNKGVAKDTIARVLQESDIDWEANRRKVLHKAKATNLKHCCNTDSIQARARLAQFLHYRGFDDMQMDSE